MVWKFNNGDQTVRITKYSNTENARTSTTDSLASFVNVADRLTNGTLSSQRHIVPPQRCEYSHSTNTCHSFQEKIPDASTLTFRLPQIIMPVFLHRLVALVSSQEVSVASSPKYCISTNPQILTVLALAPHMPG